MKLQLPLAYPHCEPELAIARDWHAYRPLSEAVLAFGLGIGGLFAMGGISYLYMAPDEHGISTRVPWIPRESSMPANDAAKGKGEPFVYKFAAAAGGDDAEDDDDDDE